MNKIQKLSFLDEKREWRSLAPGYTNNAGGDQQNVNGTKGNEEGGKH